MFYHNMPKSSNIFALSSTADIVDFEDDFLCVKYEITFISFQLLRMLEEEMTKNVALRKNIEDLSRTKT